jgi:hypothetical protein
MTRLQKLAGVAVFAFAICGALLTAQATRPPVHLAGANLADASTHTCVDMNGKALGWGFGNVPFAAIYDAKPDAAI